MSLSRAWTGADPYPPKLSLDAAAGAARGRSLSEQAARFCELLTGSGLGAGQLVAG
jgi:hypothetical protein